MLKFSMIFKYNLSIILNLPKSEPISVVRLLINWSCLMSDTTLWKLKVRRREPYSRKPKPDDIGHFFEDFIKTRIRYVPE